MIISFIINQLRGATYSSRVCNVVRAVNPTAQITPNYPLNFVRIASVGNSANRMLEKSDLQEPARLRASGGTWPMSASGQVLKLVTPCSLSDIPLKAVMWFDQ